MKRPAIKLPSSADTAEIQVDGRTLRFEHLGKTLFPDEGIARRDLLEYYAEVGSVMVPHLAARPLTVQRWVNGIGARSFFQRGVPESWPGWLRREPVFSEHSQEMVDYPIVDDTSSLLYLTYLGCIDQHPWLSRIETLDTPDWVLVDLDPNQCPFERVVEAALLVRRILDDIGLASYPKTTGATGLHIAVPLEPVYRYDQTRAFAEILARIANAQRPDLFTQGATVSKRAKGKVYFDYLQNSLVKSMAAPYSVRPRRGAPVSMPLDWQEVNPKLDPGSFHMRNALKRIEKFGDLFSPMLKGGQRIESALESLGRILRRE